MSENEKIKIPTQEEVFNSAVQKAVNKLATEYTSTLSSWLNSIDPVRRMAAIQIISNMAQRIDYKQKVENVSGIISGTPEFVDNYKTLQEFGLSIRKVSEYKIVLKVSKSCMIGFESSADIELVWEHTPNKVCIVARYME